MACLLTRLNRHQLPGILVEEELAERQITTRQDDDGQAHPSVLVDCILVHLCTSRRCTFSISRRGRGSAYLPYNAP